MHLSQAMWRSRVHRSVPNLESPLHIRLLFVGSATIGFPEQRVQRPVRVLGKQGALRFVQASDAADEMLASLPPERLDELDGPHILHRRERAIEHHRPERPSALVGQVEGARGDQRVT
jgi:hypothetical protein